MKKIILLVLTVLCLTALRMPARATAYDTTVTLAGSAVEDLQDAMDALPDHAGDVRIVILNRLFSNVQAGVSLSIPTDKGITSLTLSHEGDGMVYISINKTTSSIDNPDFFYFFANGIPLVIDKGVTFGTPHAVTGPGMTSMDYYQGEIALFGGSRGADIVGDTSITINEGGGVNATIYGGGLNGKVEGNTYIAAHGGYGAIFGGGCASPAPDSGDLCADVTGKATVVADNPVIPKGKPGPGENPVNSYYNRSIHGGGRVLLGFLDFTGAHSFSAQVTGGVSILVDCQVSSAEIFGGGYILSQGTGDAVALNADVRGDVDIQIGARAQQAADFTDVAGRCAPFSVLGGGYVKLQSSSYADNASAQVYGDVTITAVQSEAAASAQGGVCSILGGGVTELGGARSNATVHGDVTIVTSRNTLPFKAIGSVYHNVGVAGGGYSSGGTANIAGNVRIHICKAPGQSDDYQNVKNVVGGGVANGAGTANVDGNVTIEIDEDIRFAGGYAPGMDGQSDYKLGVAGGGWVRAWNGTANVTGTVEITIGKGAVFGTSGARIIGGGKVNDVGGACATTGAISVTLNGTAAGGSLEELFCGSFEGRSASAPANITIKDSRVAYIYDKDGWCSEPITLQFLGSSRVYQCYLNGHGNGGGTPAKRYSIHIGDGRTPTQLLLEDFFDAAYGPEWEVIDFHIFANAALRRETDGYLCYTGDRDVHNLTIDAGGTLGIWENEFVSGSLTGGGTLELLKETIRLRMLEQGAVFTGTVKVTAPGAHEGQVIATTIQSGSQGTFVYDGTAFSVRKVPDAYGNYDWFLVKLVAPTLTAPTAMAGLVHTGSPQALVMGGSVTGGVLLYSLDGVNYAERVPTGTEAGSYTVYYKVRGDAGYSDLPPQTIAVSIAASAQPPAPIAAYRITASAGTGGTISPDGVVRVSPGGTRTFTMTPAQGYAIADVLVDGRSVGAVAQYTFYHVSQPHSIEALFVEKPGWSDCVHDRSCPIWPFQDADATRWYHDGVHYCLDAGLMQGYGNNYFRPERTLSRAELTQILYNLAGRPAVSGGSFFGDVDSGAWYADAVNWAAGSGVVLGYGNGDFGPDNPVTREQLAAMLYRYAAACGEDVRAGAESSIRSYRDFAQISDWAFAALQWADGAGIVNGKGDGILDPGGLTIRAEAATMFQRFLVDAAGKNPR